MSSLAKNLRPPIDGGMVPVRLLWLKSLHINRYAPHDSRTLLMDRGRYAPGVHRGAIGVGIAIIQRFQVEHVSNQRHASNQSIVCKRSTTPTGA